MLSPEFPPPETPQTRAEALSARIKSENLHGLTREINSRRRNSRRRIRPGKRSCHFRCLRRTEFPPFLPPTGGETPSRIRAGSSPTHWRRRSASAPSSSCGRRRAKTLARPLRFPPSCGSRGRRSRSPTTSSRTRPCSRITTAPSATCAQLSTPSTSASPLANAPSRGQKGSTVDVTVGGLPSSGRDPSGQPACNRPKTSLSPQTGIRPFSQGTHTAGGGGAFVLPKPCPCPAHDMTNHVLDRNVPPLLDGAPGH